jgi:SNF2 family DNA or RNA helicase
VSVHGDVSALDRQAAIDAFQNGEVDHILVTYGAGSEGTTLTRAPVAFRVQRPWSSIQDQQAPDRNHRIGSEHHDQIVYVDFVTLDSVEEDLIEMHEQKRGSQQEILRDVIN